MFPGGRGVAKKTHSPEAAPVPRHTLLPPAFGGFERPCCFLSSMIVFMGNITGPVDMDVRVGNEGFAGGKGSFL